MSSKTRILLAEDDLNLGYLVSEMLESEGYSVKLARDGESALKFFNQEIFDLCILDVMMPAKDGFLVAAEIRKKNELVPIIFLTARAMKEDKIKGFRTGADDYLTKPFEEEELLLRIEALMRRAPKQQSQSVEDNYQIGRYTFYPGNQELVKDHDAHRLTEKESTLLTQLVVNKNKICRREDLLLSVWGKNDYFLGRSLDVFITKLRKYLKDDPTVNIENIHGVGFILKTG